jgi:chromate transporter
VFDATVPVRTGPFAFNFPVLSSLDPWALGLSVAAAVAIFRFKAGMILTLASSCAAGVILYLAGAIN